MKLRHRLFLMMLAAFLLLLCAGAGIIIQQSFTSAIATETDRALTESAVIAASIRQRVNDIGSKSSADAAPSASLKAGELQSLRDEMEKQNAFYSAQGVTLSLLRDGLTLWGGEWKAPELMPKAGTRRYQLQDKVLRIAQRLDASLVLMYERDVGGLYQNRDRLLSLALFLCIAGSVLILIGAMVIARIIMKPVDTLQKAAGRIAAGDYSAPLDTAGQDETAELARQFEKMTVAVKAREEALTEQAERKQLFIDSLAHEMRTPLTAVMGYARYLQSVNASEEERQSALSHIAGEAQRLKSLDETLMALTRMTHDQAELCPVDIPSLMQEAASIMLPLFEEKGVTLSVRAAKGTWQGDAPLLMLIIENLLQNALTASRPKDTVTLLGERDRLTVSDTGIGMTGEQLSRACEPFYKADKARTRRAGGAGLGLTLASEAAKLLGARLALSSVPDKGTTASLLFDNSVTTV